MKWNVKQLQSAVSRGKGGVASLPSLILVYGEDTGGVRDYCQKLSGIVAPDLNDPFNVDRIRVEEIVESPARLVDSAGMISMGGDMRLVKVEGINENVPKRNLEKVTEAVEICLEALDAGRISNCVIVIGGAGLDNKSPMAKLVEKSKLGAGVRCFLDNDRDLGGVISGYFQQQNKRVAPDAMAFLRENLGNDREVTQNELEKLALYVGDVAEVTLADCLVSVASAPSVNVFKLCDAIGSRNKRLTDSYIANLSEEGEDFTMVSALVLRHLRRLMQAKEMVARGMSPEMAIGKLAPPVFFGKPEFLAQVRGYPMGRLKTLADKFYEMQSQSRQGTVDSNLVIKRAILGLSA